jgi:hypothetical protein
MMPILAPGLMVGLQILHSNSIICTVREACTPRGRPKRAHPCIQFTSKVGPLVAAQNIATNNEPLGG